MNDVKVKICGIRSLESAQAAIDAGADFLGLNFVKESKRYIYPIRAKQIIDTIRIKKQPSCRRGTESGIKVVGVFQDQSVDEVNNISKFLGLDYVQLHGEEDMNYISQVKTKVIKTVVIPTGMERSHTTELQKELNGMRFLDFARNDKVKYLLLDRIQQGTGNIVDIQKAKKLAEIYPIFFAGGLTPENITEVVKEVKPFAVDVASGIETNGVEDPKKIRLFIQKAKNVGGSI